MDLNNDVNQVEILRLEIKKILNGEKMSASNVMFILVSLMQTVESFNNLKGVNKKHLILSVLNKYIEEEVEDEDEERTLKLLVSMTLPSAMDMLVSIDKKELKIKLSKLCGCL